MTELYELIEQMRGVIFPSFPQTIFPQVYTLSDNIVLSELVLRGFQVLRGSNGGWLLGVGAIHYVYWASELHGVDSKTRPYLYSCLRTTSYHEKRHLVW